MDLEPNIYQKCHGHGKKNMNMFIIVSMFCGVSRVLFNSKITKNILQNLTTGTHLNVSPTYQEPTFFKTCISHLESAIDQCITEAQSSRHLRYFHCLTAQWLALEGISLVQDSHVLLSLLSCDVMCPGRLCTYIYRSTYMGHILAS